MNAVQNEWGSWHLAVSGTCRYFTPTLRPSLGHTTVSRWRSTDSKSTNCWNKCNSVSSSWY